MLGQPVRVGSLGGRPPGEEDLPGRPLGERKDRAHVDDRPELVFGGDGVDADASIAVADEQLGALAGGAREALEGRMRELPERELAHRGRREPQQSRAERVAEPAHVEDVAVLFQRSDQPVGRGPGQPRHPDDVRERPCSRFDGIHHGDGTVEDPDGCLGTKG